MMTVIKNRRRNTSQVFLAPSPGVFSTHMHGEHVYDRHFHDIYSFGVMEEGAHVSASGRGRVRAYAGDVLTNNPGEIHDGAPLGCVTRRWRMACVDLKTINAITRPEGGNVELTRPVLQNPNVASTLRVLFRRIEAWAAGRLDASAGELACEEALVTSVVWLFSTHGTLVARREVPDCDVRSVRDSLADRLRNPPSLDDLARMTGRSKYQVIRRFERAYGLSPFRWLLQRRAERARALIRSGRSLPESAAASGFADQSHMTRTFVRQFGFTPGMWQRAIVAKPSRFPKTVISEHDRGLDLPLRDRPILSQ
jgi:AraC-like DNA-binding protein